MFDNMFAKKPVAEAEKPVVQKAQETTPSLPPSIQEAPKEKQSIPDRPWNGGTDEEFKAWKQEREELGKQWEKEKDEKAKKEKLNGAKTELAKSDWGIRNTETKLGETKTFLEAMKLTGKTTLTDAEINKLMSKHAVGSGDAGLLEWSRGGDTQKFINGLMEISRRELSASQEQKAKCLRIIRESGDNRTESELLGDLKITDRSSQHGPYIVTDRGVDV